MEKNLTGPFKATPIKQLGQSSGRRPLTLTPQRRESGENGLALIEVNVSYLAAVTPVPAEGSAAEPIGRFRVEEENELEGFAQPCGLRGLPHRPPLVPGSDVEAVRDSDPSS